MPSFEMLQSPSSLALPAAALLLLTLLAVRMRQRSLTRRDAQETQIDWAPEATRVLSIDERQAYDVLRRAMPGYLVLAQVPLARFVRLTSRRSYTEWLQCVGTLSADLLLCDTGSRVLAAIDIRSPGETPRARRRHERMEGILKAAGIPVHTWRAGDLPGVSEVRGLLAGIGGASRAGTRPTASRPMPLIPVPEIEEVLLAGDRAALGDASDGEPEPSAFLDEFESASEHR
jgi:hypothetical protein